MDTEKATKIWHKLSVPTEVCGARRLGSSTSSPDGKQQRRPILVTVQSRDERNFVLEKAKTLQTSGEAYNRIYIKKDAHPSIRAEWKRLRDAEKTEKERPQNVGDNTHVDTRERQLYKDGELIGKWRLVSLCLL